MGERVCAKVLSGSVPLCLRDNIRGQAPGAKSVDGRVGDQRSQSARSHKAWFMMVRTLVFLLSDVRATGGC